ncbi:hypothetical protein [Noviherbaspirillum galbum]|uniref:Uncharacterized protein n=1 Tax=Noviherbaspirillum galbum TaxID=2709383 RepID=A0A6B3SR46_9BURK|nr:hypothetical protein [Noviherbaspirillum galbum]NEX60882.1 hypothetical protein [Noviherbaspirillum galbum]
MPLDFTPQFHRKLSTQEKNKVWAPLPHPWTVIVIKRQYYRAWQEEESRRLREMGEDVLAFPMSH